MTPSGCIHHGNPEFTNINGPVPTFAFSPSQILRPRVLDSMAYSGHTLGMATSGCILEFTYIGGLVPSLILGHGQVFCPRNLRHMAHDELAHRISLGGHILLGNHELSHIDRLMPIASFYPS
jgi:hypothetical protein